MHFKIDWAGLIFGSKSTVFALFYFVFEGKFPSTSPRGVSIWRGNLTEGFSHYWIGGFIFGGAFRNFTVIELDMHYANIQGIIITKFLIFFKCILMFSKFAFLYPFLVFFSSF